MQPSEDGLGHTFMNDMQIHAIAIVMCRCSLATTCKRAQRPFATTDSWESQVFCIGWCACEINISGALSFLLPKAQLAQRSTSLLAPVYCMDLLKDCYANQDCIDWTVSAMQRYQGGESLSEPSW